MRARILFILVSLIVTFLAPALQAATCFSLSEKTYNPVHEDIVSFLKENIRYSGNDDYDSLLSEFDAILFEEIREILAPLNSEQSAEALRLLRQKNQTPTFSQYMGGVVESQGVVEEIVLNWKFSNTFYFRLNLVHELDHLVVFLSQEQFHLRRLYIYRLEFGGSRAEYRLLKKAISRIGLEKITSTIPNDFYEQKNALYKLIDQDASYEIVSAKRELLTTAICNLYFVRNLKAAARVSQPTYTKDQVSVHREAQANATQMQNYFKELSERRH
jgi:hypothetical protein